MFSFDYATNTALTQINTPFFTGAFYFASWLFNPIPFTILLILSIWGIYKKYGMRDSLMFLFAIGSAFVLAWGIKFSVDLARPINGMVSAFGPSFPSAHTAVATAYFLGLLHFLRHTKDKMRRIVHILFCIACPLFVGVSRLYLGVHWLSDVVAGYILGGVAIYVAIKLFQKS